MSLRPMNSLVPHSKHETETFCLPQIEEVKIRAQSAVTAAACAAVLASAMLCAASVQAASFDCSKARSFSEKAVCDNPQLSSLDDTLARSYAKAFSASVDKPAVAAVRIQEWRWRQVHCKDERCVENWYARRIAELDADDAQHQTRVSTGPRETTYVSKTASRVSRVPVDHQNPFPPNLVDLQMPSNFEASGANSTLSGIPTSSQQAPTSWKYSPLPALPITDTVTSELMRQPGSAVPVASRTINVVLGF